MEAVDLAGVVGERLAAAREATSGRASITLMGDRASDLRQTVIALTAGSRLSDHDGPGEATLQVLAGAARLTAGDHHEDLEQGDFVAIPHARHGLEAVTDCAVLLTVATRAAGGR